MIAIIIIIMVITIIPVIIMTCKQSSETFMIRRPHSRTFYPNLYYPTQPIYPPYQLQANYPSYFSNSILF